jgi:hypothetical protein
MTGAHHHTQLLLVEMGMEGVSKTFCLGLASNCDPSIFYFQLAKITGVSHNTWLNALFIMCE